MIFIVDFGLISIILGFLAIMGVVSVQSFSVYLSTHFGMIALVLAVVAMIKAAVVCSDKNKGLAISKTTQIIVWLSETIKTLAMSLEVKSLIDFFSQGADMDLFRMIIHTMGATIGICIELFVVFILIYIMEMICSTSIYDEQSGGLYYLGASIIGSVILVLLSGVIPFA